MSRKRVTLRIDGDAYRKTKVFPIAPIITSQAEFKSLSDNSYSALSGKNISGKSKKGFLVSGGLARIGSYVQDLYIDVESGPIAGLTLGAEDVWNGVNDAYTFILKSTLYVSEGLEREVQIDNLKREVTLNFRGQKPIVVKKAIYDIDRRLREHMKQLVSVIQDGQVEEIGFKDEGGQELLFTPKERLLLNPAISFEKPIDVFGTIVSFNKETQRGRFKVFPEQRIIDDSYSFVLATKEMAYGYIVGMTRKEVKLTVQPEVETYDTGMTRIARLVALNIEIPKNDEQVEMNFGQ
jgi:hypothetical protein